MRQLWHIDWKYLDEFISKEKKIDRNVFSTKSEEIWKSMDEVDFCDILCMPLKGKRWQEKCHEYKSQCKLYFCNHYITIIELQIQWKYDKTQKTFSCDEQLKKWRCHSVCPFVLPSIPFFSFSVPGVSSNPKEFQWCFKAV